MVFLSPECRWPFFYIGNGMCRSPVSGKRRDSLAHLPTFAMSPLFVDRARCSNHVMKSENVASWTN
jgi:hypothetical protein